MGFISSGYGAQAMVQKKILISEDISGPGIERLRDKYHITTDVSLWKDPEQLQQKLEGFHGLVVRNQTRVTADTIENARALVVIGRAGAGYDNIDVKAMSGAGIVVCYSPEENAVSVAEHVFALLLALARKIPAAARSVKDGQWDRKAFHGVELHGKTLGILGLGKIGARVALRGRAFGMRMMAHDAYLSPSHLHVTESSVALVSFDRLVSESDFLTVHLPLNEETRGLFRTENLRRMKPTAYLINTSRGEIINEDDLACTLRDERIAGAALDVREQEPPSARSPLHAFPNVILTPHTAGLTYEAQEKVVEALSEDIDRVLSGRPALRYINFSRPTKS
jgi:D-3-phosphoglycerate dehydrogenase / 2-oxoglutarate reductase